MARRHTEKALEKDAMFYVPSLSASTIVFKGMVMPEYLAQFYPDLADPRLESSVAVFHQRFSTNTLPQWRLRCHGAQEPDRRFQQEAAAIPGLAVRGDGAAMREAA